MIHSYIVSEVFVSATLAEESTEKPVSVNMWPIFLLCVCRDPWVRRKEKTFTFAMYCTNHHPIKWEEVFVAAEPGLPRSC